MKVKSLLTTISTLMPAIDSKGLVPEFSLLHFKKNCVESTDGALLVRCNLDEGSPEFSVDAEIIQSLLKTINQDDVDITIEEGTAVVKTKTMTTRLALPTIKQAPKIDFDIKDCVKDVPKGLLEGLKLCRYTACIDQTSGPLTGVRIEEDTIISCDRCRITIFQLEKAIESMTISVNLIDLASRFSKDIKSCALKGTTFYFDFEKGMMGGKLVEGEYPSEKLLGCVDEAEEGSELKLSKELKKEISEAALRQNIIQSKDLEFDRQTTVKVGKGELTLSSISQAVGSIEETIKCPDAKDVDFSFVINPMFLLGVFAEADRFVYSEKLGVVTFTGNRFMHLVKTKTHEVKNG